MLRSLLIQDFILIDYLEIDFRTGLNIITGETGAGKSIILGALGLLQGNRADTESLGDKNKKCIIEARFNLNQGHLKSLFEKLELDYDTDCILRREISPQGRSRAFVNDTPVNLQILKTVAGELFDIHSQHQSLLLANPDFRMQLIDTKAGIKSLAQEYQKNYQSYLEGLAVLRQQVSRIEQAKMEEDYWHFQLEQLADLPFRDANEHLQTEEEFEELSHAEEIQRSLSECIELIDSSEMSILSSLHLVKNALDQASRYSPRARELSSRIEQVRIELKDLVQEAIHVSESTHFQPDTLESLRQKLDILNTQLLKHRVNSLEELLDLQKEMQGKLGNISSLEEEAAAMKKNLDQLKANLVEQATHLHSKREEVLPQIDTYVSSNLRNLGIKQAHFEIQLDQASDLSTHGFDSSQFLFTANKQQKAREVSKVASGGELSRIMLCLKSLHAEAGNYPTLIFDEIDTGVSGEIAHKVGGIVRQIAIDTQVINITHLPQVAAHGDSHYLVFKDEATNTTGIKELNKDERKLEIAKMLSGAQVDDTALEHAAKLLQESKFQHSTSNKSQA